MPRYFTCTAAARPYEVGGRTFVFEPIANRGGSWFGILAVEDDSAASVLAEGIAGGLVPQIAEVSLEYFEAQKKKAGQSDNSRSYLTPQRLSAGNPLMEAVAPRAGQLTPPAEASSEKPAAPSASVSLKTTEEQPPDEPLIAKPPAKKGPAKGAS